jgi:FtsP/CotA-like multicopper oxidase with cupredoxin domain
MAGRVKRQSLSRRKLLGSALGAGTVAGLSSLLPGIKAKGDATKQTPDETALDSGESGFGTSGDPRSFELFCRTSPLQTNVNGDRYVAMSLADLPGALGEIDTSRYDPMAYLTDFYYGNLSRTPDGRMQRDYEIFAGDNEIEVAPGVYFPAWYYNGRVPGPTFRCTAGDLVRVRFVNGSSHPHTIHFHGIHAANMDGVFEVVPSGGSYTYEFEAQPFGLHLYHCHSHPLKKHIHKGLYGVFIIDPLNGRPPARELVMVMNAFDTNFDGENEVYAVNSVAHYYLRHAIELKAGELTRLYVVNLTEFDLINSIHIHANFFKVFRTGTRLESDEFTDTITLCQGERAVLEFTYDLPGAYLFHAHQSEFAELGWVGAFEVRP